MDATLSKVAEYTIEPIGCLLGRQVSYVIHCKTNLQNLRAKVDELKAARDALQNKITEAERQGSVIQPDVQLWLKTVAEITAQADELTTDESQAKLKCLYGFCPNLTVRHRLSRKSTKLLPKVAEQYDKREFSQVSCGILRKDVWSVTTLDYQAFESRMSIVKEIMDSLKDSEIQRIGVYGIGGVGKTTLVTEVYKQASGDNMLFDDVVILLDVKSTPDPDTIQKKILAKLGMDVLVKENETIEERASRLCAKTQGKKILVILDDVQEKVDLEVVGLPRTPTCKILVTCRTPDVLSFDKMRADKMFPLHLLGKEETWSLFMKMAGDVVKHKGRIQDVAVQVAEKCGGLPLLVVTVASALKGKNNLSEWKDALRRLTKFDEEELTEKAYMALEWSYNQLNDKELKPLFLLSGIIVKQNRIDVQLLLRFGVGLDLFANVNTLEEARNALDTLLGRLKDSCLLLDGDTEGVLRMHDLVCHVANRIAYRDHHMLSTEYGGELKEWPNKEFLKKCTRISLIHGNIPTLPEIPMECSELELFCLHSTEYDEWLQIPSNSFNEMQKLRVLNLTNMYIPSLPSSLQYLTVLQTLCLDRCQLGDITLLGQLRSLEVLSFSRSYVRELPKEIGLLTRLRLLDLSYCSGLEVISPNVLARLEKLEDLNMRDSFGNWEVEGKGSNASLPELKHLSMLSSLEIRIPNVDALPANLFSNKLQRFNICIGDVWDKWYARSPWEKLRNTMELNTLKLKLTKELDESLKWLIKNSRYLSLDEMEVVIVHKLNAEDFEEMIHLQLQNNVDFMAMVNKKVEFPKLETLWVHGCDNLEFLFSFSMAKSLVQLTHLKVSECKLLQEIVSSTRVDSEENMGDMFSKLQVLQLEELSNLSRFSAGNYIEFPSLVELEINGCVNMGVFIGGEVSMNRNDNGSCNEIEQRFLEEEENTDVKSETAAKNFLFNEKVGFPILERLSIDGIRELKAIWHIQLSQNSFRRLKKVNIGECNKLKSLFPPIMMRRLNALETLGIRRCDSLEMLFEEIVDAQEEQEGLEIEPPQFVFPRVTSMDFIFLPQLKGCINASQWPSLKQVTVSGCEKVGIFATEFSHFGKNYEMETLMTSQRPLFLTDKDSFLNLEVLTFNGMEVWNGPLPANQLVFGKLKSIILSLSPVRNDDNSRSLLFPNLETLELRWCPRLKSMESTAISFQNLTTLKVRSCNGFECLISYSVAKSLVQLKTLEVVNCESVVVIVASNVGDDDADDAAGNEIVFSHLQHLELVGLQKLQGFCSKNCTVKVPSSITLEIYSCSIKLNISSDGVLLTEVDDRYQQSSQDEQQNDTEPGLNDNGA